MQAVTPPPDGGYPGQKTAESQSPLLHLAGGTYNTALGWASLGFNMTGNFNTGVGAAALLNNTADNNTATGAGALLTTPLARKTQLMEHSRYLATLEVMTTQLPVIRRFLTMAMAPGTGRWTASAP